MQRDLYNVCPLNPAYRKDELAFAGLATVLDQSHVAPEDTEHLGTLLDELEVLSEEEAQARLDKEI